MPTRRSRSALLGAVLALVAMLGLIGLSGWHGAIVHDDDPVHAVSIEHSHGGSDQTDPDGPIHVLAHATGQLLTLDAATATLRATVVSDRTWPTGIAGLLRGIGPSGLLRPPQG
ncbi:hypothetical protein E2E30_09305 [Sphingomonas sp. AAP5]|uniref:hypothetical protein n=1 Tax=Sphingomonas sp. AAP5 TaxID=1523415 RepID=UPI0010574A34|nr:hypothetical protein [Sphingomonas sp. AAP5]QBM75942.1 hypothetical protein E2E30_09305 [Sphingomonas sp. AAP5]